MDKKEPLVSVVMPAHNADEYIEEAIESVLSQSLKELELLVVNDRSSDKTCEIVEALHKKDSRVRLLQSRGVGVSAARNTGLDAAKGKYIGFLDADDTYLPGALQARVAVLEEKPKLALVHSGVDYVDERGRSLGRALELKRTLSFLDMTGNPAHLNSILGKRFLMRRVKFDESLTNGEDWLYLSTILRSGAKSDYVSGGKATYRFHRNSTVIKNMDKHETQVTRVIDENFSASKRSDAAKVYANGLDKDKLPGLLMGRSYNRFVWAIMNLNFPVATEILLGKLNDAWLNGKTETFFENSLKMGAIRNYLIHIDNISSIPMSYKGPIYRYLDGINLGNRCPALIKAFNTVFGFDLPVNEAVFLASKPKIEDHNYGRPAHASVDETRIIHDWFNHKPGMTMIDVGAHYGGSAHKFAVKGWNIHCFEPDPNNRVKLIQKLGDMDNVIIDTRAISDAEQKGVSFFSSEESTGISGLLSFRDTHEEIAKVDITTLTNIFKERNITEVDFLKIDVEGHDFGVLKGVPWDEVSPKVIECEFEDAKTLHLGHVWTDICDFLKAKGYTVFVSEWHPIIRYGIPHDWHRIRQYPCELASSDAWGNLLAFKGEPDVDRLYEALTKNISHRSE